ncbi:MAG: molybdopterin-guanine dinucleotide biosynthesis protein B [Hyphomicrobium sp.]|nr:molybdopterin-guanine dinucleotide biosynthesis protein B [Hyphomicrobium sp.]
MPSCAAAVSTVSTIKYAKAGVSLDQPGKDSYVHREAGAAEVALITPQRWALMRELHGMPEPSIGEVIGTMTSVDIVLVEGLREAAYECIEVRRSGDGDQYHHPRKVAIATDRPVAAPDIPRLDLNAPSAICEFLLRHWGLLVRVTEQG